MPRSPPRTAAGIRSTSSGAPCLKTTTNSRNILLVSYCLCAAGSRHRNQPSAPASYPRVTGRAQARVLIVVVLMALMVPGIQWSCRCQCQPRARTGERPGAHAGRSTGSARTTSARAMTQRPRRTKGGTAHLLRRSLIAVCESPGGTDSAELAMTRLRILLLHSPAGGRASRLIGRRSAACGDC